jgi:hypothetical protein
MARQVTITLADDVAEKLEQERRSGTAVDEAVKEAVRKVLEPAPAKTSRPFVVHARDLGARPDVNFDCAWKLLDELDVRD